MLSYSLYHKIICLLFTGCSLFLEDIRRILVNSFITTYISVYWIDRALTAIFLAFLIVFLYSWFTTLRPYIKDIWPWKLFF